MAFLLACKQALISLGIFFGFKDILEICLLAIPLYLFSRWLVSDTTKHLLLSFYGYCALLIFAWAFDLQTISFVMIALAPAAVFLWIAFHQKVLQRNFVTYKKMLPAEQIATAWHEALIRECLVVANNNKDITCVIEQKDAIQPYLSTFIAVQAPIHHDVMTFITASSQYQEEGMLIFSATGSLMAVNATWKMPTTASWVTGAINVEKLVEHNALFYSTHFDAITILLSHKKRLFTVIFDGIKHDNLSAAQTITLIQKRIHVPAISKELHHVSQSTHQQRAS